MTNHYALVTLSGIIDIFGWRDELSTHVLPSMAHLQSGNLYNFL